MRVCILRLIATSSLLFSLSPSTQATIAFSDTWRMHVVVYYFMFFACCFCRWCYYKETERVLGQTFGVLVLQDFEVRHGSAC